MKKQVIVIHGGMTFDRYEYYMSFLKNKDVEIDDFKTGGGWKNSLAKELGNDFEILNPRMPNSANARYEEWKIWFAKMSPFIEEGAVLMGQSLGGIFLAKCLSEISLPKKLKALILVSAPFDQAEHETLGDFGLPSSIDNCARQAEKIFLIHSKDDPIVPFSESAKYQKSFPTAELIIFEDRGHFNQETFPELVGLIKGLR
ncbi:hypothetical protein C4572_01170 [Candidatus Parcubacteria bacterium]|nr:MAG: hypothetical protein C4572_01170 [Candidatus Parcubacteria bacterium]